MHGTRSEGWALAEQVAGFVAENPSGKVEVLLCPPAALLWELSGFTDDGLKFGGQDCHAEEKGAHTGDISAEMLADAGADYVIVGHSERRQHHGENDIHVRAKALAARRAGLIPIICIGETLQQREQGRVQEVLTRQIAGSVPPEFSAADFVLAYEPVWAIGTGKVAGFGEIAETHRLIAAALPPGTKILYGGSVKPDNAADILALQEVQGVLVGGASLQAESFNAIIGAAAAQANK